MSRWQAQTVRAIQRAVPVAVITGSGAAQQNNNGHSNANKILSASSNSKLLQSDDVSIAVDEFEDIRSSNSSNEFERQEECTFTSQQTFSASEVSSLRDDM